MPVGGKAIRTIVNPKIEKLLVSGTDHSKEYNLMKADEAWAGMLGEKFSNGRLTLKILEKDFSVDENGEIFTDIHANQWIVPPLFNYILTGKGEGLTENLVPFRELDTSKDWTHFF
ncbi:MAG: DUF3786 domain-containing protein [Desulfobacterales bacterium]|nr:DUF3786 domain-containing protein [Desulfobacterales bacterium]